MTRPQRFSQRRPRHVDTELQPYFVTSRVRGSRRLFIGEANKAAVETLFAQRERYGLLILAYVFMPDHAHFVLVPNAGYTIEQTMRVIKGSVARVVNGLLGLSGALWQGGFWDKMPRNVGELNRFIAYTEANPDRARLAAVRTSAGDARCWQDYGAVLRTGAGMAMIGSLCGMDARAEGPRSGWWSSGCDEPGTYGRCAG